MDRHVNQFADDFVSEFYTEDSATEMTADIDSDKIESLDTK